MQWKEYSKLKGQHAFLSASKYSWLGYDDDKLVSSYFNFLSIAKGTRLYALVAARIDMDITMLQSTATLH